jgi:hypothetical protein
MLDEISVWIESYSGSTYDISDEIMTLKDPNYVFLNTTEWKLMMAKMIDDLSEIYDIISNHSDLIPDDLPDAETMKKMFASTIIGAMLNSLNDTKRQLHITTHSITKHDILVKEIETMYDLITMLSMNDKDTIINDKLFDKYNEENDDAFIEYFQIASNDLSAMHDIVSSVIEEFGSDDSDDTEDFDD